jgi:putative pyridoxal-dependent aspartate 1-decarboxylase
MINALEHALSVPPGIFREASAGHLNGEVTMRQQQNVYRATEISRDALAEKVMRLFDSSADPTSAEKEFEARISATAQEFLRATRVSTDVELATLAAKFKDSQIPVEPSPASAYLDELVENIIPEFMHIASPRFIGHMASALPRFVPSLAKLVTAMNQNLVKLETSRAFSFYERQVLAKIHRLVFDFSDDFYEHHIQRRESTLGMMLSGGTTANLTALWCARNASLGAKDRFPGVEAEGLPAALDFYGYKAAVMIGSTLMHYSIDKAAAILGIGTRNLIRVPALCNNRIDLLALRRTIAECHAQNLHIIAIIGNAGTTDAGGVDPLNDMAEVAHEAHIHFHVDAAWGGPLLFSERHRSKLTGIQHADSVTIDGHKQFYLPFGIGMLVLRNPELAKGIEKHAYYIVRPGSFDLGKRSLEGSRPGMALFLDVALNIIGQKGYGILINEGIRKTQYMANSIRTRPEFELLADPEINILLYRYLPAPWRESAARGQLTGADNQCINAFNERLQKAQRKAGRTFVSRTTSHTTAYGRDIPITALRAVMANPLTAEEDIDAVLDDQVQLAQRLA